MIKKSRPPQFIPKLDKAKILSYTVAEVDLLVKVGISASIARRLRRQKILPDIIYRKNGPSRRAQGLRYNAYLFALWLALRDNPSGWEQVTKEYYSILFDD
jgi:hypothetical protein